MATELLTLDAVRKLAMVRARRIDPELEGIKKQVTSTSYIRQFRGGNRETGFVTGVRIYSTLIQETKNHAYDARVAVGVEEDVAIRRAAILWRDRLDLEKGSQNS